MFKMLFSSVRKSGKLEVNGDGDDRVGNDGVYKAVTRNTFREGGSSS